MFELRRLWILWLLQPLLLLQHPTVEALHIVIPGGTGDVGKLLASKLPQHQITFLSRQAFLAATPARVSENYGWVGADYLRKNPHVTLRFWDGGDFPDIAGCEWLGWQEDTLAKADIVINLCGGFTQQRVMATERLVRESLRVNKEALQVVVGPTEEDFEAVTPGLPTIKKQRLQQCEQMVMGNCPNAVSVRLPGFRLEESCAKLIKVIEDFEASR